LRLGGRHAEPIFAPIDHFERLAGFGEILLIFFRIDFHRAQFDGIGFQIKVLFQIHLGYDESFAHFFITEQTANQRVASGGKIGDAIISLFIGNVAAL